MCLRNSMRIITMFYIVKCKVHQDRFKIYVSEVPDSGSDSRIGCLKVRKQNFVLCDSLRSESRD